MINCVTTFSFHNILQTLSRTTGSEHLQRTVRIRSFPPASDDTSRGVTVTWTRHTKSLPSRETPVEKTEQGILVCVFCFTSHEVHLLPYGLTYFDSSKEWLWKGLIIWLQVTLTDFLVSQRIVKTSVSWKKYLGKSVVIMSVTCIKERVSLRNSTHHWDKIDS